MIGQNAHPFVVEGHKSDSAVLWSLHQIEVLLVPNYNKNENATPNIALLSANIPLGVLENALRKTVVKMEFGYKLAVLSNPPRTAHRIVDCLLRRYRATSARVPFPLTRQMPIQIQKGATTLKRIMWSTLKFHIVKKLMTVMLIKSRTRQ